MIKIKILFVLTLLSSVISTAQPEKLIYHDIKVDATGNIIPWYSKEPRRAYSHVIKLLWHFWDTMRLDLNGLPYYMNHQVWQPYNNDPRGLGDDQIQMALSSWRLLYTYTGEERIRENMKFMADYYITHGFSPAECRWPDIPYPYNTLVYSGIYDGDMIIGKNYTQPDKAGSLGIELVRLFKMMNRERYPNVTDKLYLDAAIQIANTLAERTIEGDENNSPLPFKVNAITGEVGQLFVNTRNGTDTILSNYSSNWSGTLDLFLELIELNKGNADLYNQAFNKILNWMKNYPLKNNKWGPFFEDIRGWSDTQINAITFAQFIMNHQEYFPDWETEVTGIFDWVYKTIGNRSWEKYGVIVVNEQTAYQVPGNSHTSRQASAEIQFVSLTGDSSRKQNAIRQLNWATYMVDNDGKNRYPRDQNWLTDGYGDYVRHYLRAMADLPELSPSDEEHILYSSSVVQQVQYMNQIDESYTQANPRPDNRNIRIRYTTFDMTGIEKIHLLKKPSQVLLNRRAINETNNLKEEGYMWKPFRNGGILTVNRINGNSVTVVDY